MTTRPAMFGGNPLAASLSALFGGLSAAGQPGGIANFGLGATQGAQNFQQTQQAQQMMQARQQQMEMQQQQQEQEMARAEQERAQREAAKGQVAAMFGGGGQQVGGPGGIQTASTGQPGQPAMFQNWTPEQRALIEQNAQIDPVGTMQFLQQQAFEQPEQQKLPADVQEYEYAKAQGYQGTFFDYQNDLRKAGAMQANTTIYNKDYGTIPPGFRLVETPQGAQMEAVPGSPAATEAAAAETKAAEKKATQAQSADIVTQDIGRIIEKVEASPTATTGFIGNMLKGIGGTEAGNVKSLLGTVEANTAFDRLQQMRNESPTGGALGSITERELALLAATKGALEQSQDDKQLVFNLKRLNNVILDIVHGDSQGPQRYGLGNEGGSDLKSKYGLE